MKSFLSIGDIKILADLETRFNRELDCILQYKSVTEFNLHFDSYSSKTINKSLDEILFINLREVLIEHHIANCENVLQELSNNNVDVTEQRNYLKNIK